jgi:hypothetical protein
VELVYEYLVGVQLMLGYLFDKCFVIESVDLLKLPFLGGYLELETGF